MANTIAFTFLSLSHHRSPFLKPSLSLNPTKTLILTLNNSNKKSYSLSPHSKPYPILLQHNNDPLHQTLEKKLSIKQDQPLKFTLWVLFWATLSLAWFAASGEAKSASDSIPASGFGVKIAGKLRSFGLADECVVFCLAILPVIELRGAIPVGYWLQLKPVVLTVLSVLGGFGCADGAVVLVLAVFHVIKLCGAIPMRYYWLQLKPVVLTVLSVLGNMVPVPFILLYLKKFTTLLAGKNQYASRMLDLLFKRANEKAGPVEEFQWLGLMLFVAVPFPGTGAWTGAIVASVLDMPFWHAISANFCGVVLAGLLVNLLVNLGLKYAIITGVGLFVVSTFMWSILRNVKKSLSREDF